MLPDLFRGSNVRKRSSLRLSIRPSPIASLKHFWLTKYLDTVYGSELEGRPSKKGVLIADVLAFTHPDPTEPVMPGDRRYDIVGALANQVFPAGLW
jgi:phosphoglycolate phosphatase